MPKFDDCDCFCDEGCIYWEAPTSGFEDLVQDSGSWSNSSGVFSTSNTNAQLRCTVEEAEHDEYVQKLECRGTSSGDIARIIANYTDSDNYWFVEIEFGSSEATIRLYHRQDAVNGLQDSDTLSWTPGDWMPVIICSDDETLTAQIHAKDEAPLDPVGTTGLVLSFHATSIPHDSVGAVGTGGTVNGSVEFRRWQHESHGRRVEGCYRCNCCPNCTNYGEVASEGYLVTPTVLRGDPGWRGSRCASLDDLNTPIEFNGPPQIKWVSFSYYQRCEWRYTFPEPICWRTEWVQVAPNQWEPILVYVREAVLWVGVNFVPTLLPGAIVSWGFGFCRHIDGQPFFPQYPFGYNSTVWGSPFLGLTDCKRDGYWMCTRRSYDPSLPPPWGDFFILSARIELIT